MLLPWTASRGAMSQEGTRQSETMVPYSSISFYLKLALQSLLGRAAPCGQGVTVCHPGIGDNSSVVCFGAARHRQLCPQKEMTGGVQCPKQTPHGGGGQSGLLSSFCRREVTPLSPPRPPLLPLSLSLCSRCTGLRGAPPAHPVWSCPRAFAHVRQYPDHHPYGAFSLTLFGSGPRCHFLGDLVLKYPPVSLICHLNPCSKLVIVFIHMAITAAASALGYPHGSIQVPQHPHWEGEAPLPASFCRWEH